MKLFERQHPSQFLLIELGKSYFRIGTVLRRNQNSFLLLNFSSFYLEKEGEEASFWQELREALNSFVSPGMKKASLIFSPPYITVKAKLIPLIPKAEVANYCNQVLVQEMGIVRDDYYLERRIRKFEDLSRMSALVVGIKRRAIDKLVQILNEFNLEIQRIDASVGAIENLLSGLDLMSGEEETLILRMEENFSELLMLRGSFVLGYKSLDFGVKNIRASLIRTVYTENVPLELGEREAEKIVREVGYSLQDGKYLGITYQQLRILLLPALEILSQNISSFIQEYKEGLPPLKISHIYLMDKAKLIKGLGEFLEKKFSFPHLYLDAVAISENFGIQTTLSENAKLEISLFSSLAYPPTKKYDFFPLSYKVLKKTQRIKQKALVYLLSFFLSLGLFYFGLRLTILYLDRIRSVAQNTYLEMSPLQEKVNQLENFNQEVNLLQDRISKIYARYPDWVGILKELSRIVPEEIKIEELQSRRELARKLLYLRGELIAEAGSSNLILNKFVRILQQSFYFKNVELLNTSHISSGYIGKTSFELQAVLR